MSESHGTTGHTFSCWRRCRGQSHTRRQHFHSRRQCWDSRGQPLAESHRPRRRYRGCRHRRRRESQARRSLRRPPPPRRALRCAHAQRRPPAPDRAAAARRLAQAPWRPAVGAEPLKQIPSPLAPAMAAAAAAAPSPRREAARPPTGRRPRGWGSHLHPVQLTRRPPGSLQGEKGSLQREKGCWPACQQWCGSHRRHCHRRPRLRSLQSRRGLRRQPECWPTRHCAHPCRHWWRQFRPCPLCLSAAVQKGARLQWAKAAVANGPSARRAFPPRRCGRWPRCPGANSCS
mmetsp:Transcript_17981/g.50447  ORF Transcript_17981/g.50447 Transcript_17981/m.50447 type:complete len:288 (-) Transcript_17981:1486-2349(-)